MLAQSAVIRLHVVCPSVCLSVTFRYRGQIGWNSYNFQSTHIWALRAVIFAIVWCSCYVLTSTFLHLWLGGGPVDDPDLHCIVNVQIQPAQSSLLAVRDQSSKVKRSKVETAWSPAVDGVKIAASLSLSFVRRYRLVRQSVEVVIVGWPHPGCG